MSIEIYIVTEGPHYSSSSPIGMFDDPDEAMFRARERMLLGDAPHTENYNKTTWASHMPGFLSKQVALFSNGTDEFVVTALKRDPA